MTRRIPIPQRPVTIVTENGDDAMIAQVQATAEQGVALAQNARAMARTVGDRVTTVETQALTLQQLADDYQSRVAESTADRAALHAKTDTQAAALELLAGDLARIQLMPGPDGAAGRDGAPGQDGAQGLRGTDGKDGAPGAKGDPGKDGAGFDPAVASAITARVATLEGANRSIGFGLAATPVLALLATTDITVTLSRQMPDTVYTVELARTGSITADMLTVKAKTRTTVTYTLKAAVALGAAVIGVIAYYP